MKRNSMQKCRPIFKDPDNKAFIVWNLMKLKCMATLKASPSLMLLKQRLPMRECGKLPTYIFIVNACNPYATEIPSKVEKNFQ